MLANLVQQRSQLAEEILNYLAEVVRQTAVLPACFPAHLQPDENSHMLFDDIRQVVQVVEDRSGSEAWRTEGPERLRGRLHCQPYISKSPVTGDGRV